jgi:beta-glucosidase
MSNAKITGKGLQGGNVSATVKHFAAYGTPEQGLNTGPVHGGERELRTTYLPPYKRQIIDGGVFSIMSNYASYDGVPSIANHHLLTDILRTEWGYKYWVTSDAGATDRICQGFKMCQSVPLDHAAITLYVSHKEVPCSALLTVTGSQRRKRRGNGWRILQF